MKYSIISACIMLLCITAAVCSAGHTSATAQTTPSCSCCNHGSASKLPVVQFFTANLLWSQGQAIVTVLIALLLIGLLAQSKLVTSIALMGWAFSLYFFRNPERHCIIPEGITKDRVVICPADGTVVEIVDVSDDFVGADAQRVSIFLSPLDVHVQWAPISGTIEQILYRPGKFVVAYAPKSSDINERNDLYIAQSDTKRIIVRQIAGFVARRICCWVEEHEPIRAGTKYGMIRFGSRVDIIMPKTVALQVATGQTVVGGRTVMGIWQS